MGTINCCKDCQKKIPGCHSTCPDYIIEKAFYEEKKLSITRISSFSVGWTIRCSTVLINARSIPERISE